MTQHSDMLSTDIKLNSAPEKEKKKKVLFQEANKMLL